MFPQTLMPRSQRKPAKARHSPPAQLHHTNTNSQNQLSSLHRHQTLGTFFSTVLHSHIQNNITKLWVLQQRTSMPTRQHVPQLQTAAKPHSFSSKGHPLVAQLVALWSCTATGSQLWHLWNLGKAEGESLIQRLFNKQIRALMLITVCAMMVTSSPGRRFFENLSWSNEVVAWVLPS